MAHLLDKRLSTWIKKLDSFKIFTVKFMTNFGPTLTTAIKLLKTIPRNALSKLIFNPFVVNVQADADRIQSKLNENWNIAMELDLSSDLKEQVDILRSLVGGDRIEVGYILPYLRTAGGCLGSPSDVL